MKHLIELFFNMYAVYYFSPLFGVLVFLGRINTRVYTNYYLNIRLFRSVLSQPNPFLTTWNKLKLSFFGGKGVPQEYWMVSTTVNE